MSENLLATLLTLGILAAIFAWPPLLRVVCPACSRLLGRSRPVYEDQESTRNDLSQSRFK